MIRVGAGTQHKKEKKQPKIPLECFILRPKFLECICLEKTPTSFPLDTQYTSKKTKEMVKITKSTRSLFLSCGSFCLLLSLSFVPVLRFLRVRILSLSPFKMRLCARLCARVCVSRAAWSSSRSFVSISTTSFLLVRSRTDVSSLYHHIIFSFSLLHRRRLRRRTDHGHDRSEVPAHRGNTINVLFFCERRWFDAERGGKGDDGFAQSSLSSLS